MLSSATLNQSDVKTVLVTGATSGIGFETVSQLLLSGTQVISVGRNKPRLEEIERLAPEKSKTLNVDLFEPSSASAIATSVSGLDGVVFAAGKLIQKPLRYLSDSDVSNLFSVNVFSPLAIVRELLKAKKLKRGSSVVFVSSTASSCGVPGLTAYAATKGALEAAVRSLAIEVANSGIRVNSVAPGHVHTAMTAELSRRVSKEELDIQRGRHPLGFGSPADVAAAIAFLLSDGARWVTGTTLTVDGGYTCQ